MARTGRPIIKRTVESIDRDIAALKRLQKSIDMDSSLDASLAETAVMRLQKAIDVLNELRLAV